MKEFKVKIKLWFSDGRVRSESDVLVEILKRMKLTKFLEWNVTLTYDEVKLYNKIEAQIKQQYDCNKREIAFKIDVY